VLLRHLRVRRDHHLLLQLQQLLVLLVLVLLLLLLLLCLRLLVKNLQQVVRRARRKHARPLRRRRRRRRNALLRRLLPLLLLLLVRVKRLRRVGGVVRGRSKGRRRQGIRCRAAAAVKPRHADRQRRHTRMAWLRLHPSNSFTRAGETARAEVCKCSSNEVLCARSSDSASEVFAALRRYKYQ
jgi:hypothetical protein